MPGGDGGAAAPPPVFSNCFLPCFHGREAVQAGSHQVSVSLKYVRELIIRHAARNQAEILLVSKESVIDRSNSN